MCKVFKISIVLILMFVVNACSSHKVNIKHAYDTMAYAPKGPIQDMVLVYNGDRHRQEWLIM